MRRLLPPLALAASLVAASLVAAGLARADDLTLRRVMLSTAGIGYFEYEAAADGPVTLGLDVPLSQVDDVLASLVVFDSAGSIGGLELPGQDGSHAAFFDVPFGPNALGSALDYLNGLQGTVLQVKGPRPMTGQLLRAERVVEAAPPGSPQGAGTPRTRVALLTDNGLEQFVLEEADSVQVADPALRARIDRALSTLRGATASDSRHVSLRSTGAGHRQVRVGYVAGAPLWKSTYRLVLPEADGGKARLQGWAVLENVSASDWNGIELSLQYGNPVTFRQALYRSYYVQRPDVPVEVLGRILPGVDAGARPMLQAAKAAGGAGRTMALAAPPPPPAPAAAAAESAPMAEPEEQAVATEAAESTLFRLATPVVLAAGHSAAVPILDREMPAERVGVVQQGRPHPLQALRLVNDSGASLPAGVLTLYDPLDAASFAGDARLGGLPSGDSRLLQFAEDLRTSVEWQTDEGSTLVGVTASQGVLHVLRRQRRTERITLAAPAAEARHLLLEIPRPGDGTLSLPDGLTGTEQTATSWRVKLALKPGEQRTIVAIVDRPAEEDLSLLEDNGLLATVLNEQALSAPARAALRHLADLRSALATQEAARDTAKRQIADVEHDEDRLRRNIATVPAGDALHGKLLRNLEADEEKLAGLSAAAKDAEAAVAQARAALEQAVAALRLG